MGGERLSSSGAHRPKMLTLLSHRRMYTQLVLANGYGIGQRSIYSLVPIDQHRHTWMITNILFC